MFLIMHFQLTQLVLMFLVYLERIKRMMPTLLIMLAILAFDALHCQQLQCYEHLKLRLDYQLEFLDVSRYTEGYLDIYPIDPLKQVCAELDASKKSYSFVRVHQKNRDIFPIWKLH